jgi:acetoacetyl-CoA synthetase
MTVDLPQVQPIIKHTSRVPQWQGFAAFASRRYGAPEGGYDPLWQWSVENVPTFWRAVWDFFDIAARNDTAPGAGDGAILQQLSMPGAHWFPGVELNYVDQVLRHAGRDGAAIIGVDELGLRTTVAWKDLPGQVGALATALRGLGVGVGDVVAAYLPDVPEAMMAFLATAAVGATWSGCGQDYAPDGAAARLHQLKPKVLFVADGYWYSGRYVDKREDALALHRLLDEPVLVAVERSPADRHVPGTFDPDVLRYRDLVASPVALTVAPVPFDHPLWVLFSSGTTGRPKGIVHGHGGVLIEHLKTAVLQTDLAPGDVLFWQTALSWMMWNFRVSGLLCGVTVMCYSGHPMRPDAGRLWELLERERVTYFGTSPGHLLASSKEAIVPAEQYDLSHLKGVGSTGAPLTPDLHAWVTGNIGADVAVSSITGGTDVATAFAGGVPGDPGFAGELTARYLGVDLESWSNEGLPGTDRVGEMVILQPMPSMPVAFWDDPDGSRYRSAYFEHEWTDGPRPGVWRHGDWVTLTERGSLIVHGRSDATLNRHGVRMGSADIYDVVEGMDEITEACVVGIDGPQGRYWMPLFVTLADGASLTPELIDEIRNRIRLRLSPRHVPDEVIEAPGIPHTRTGKKLEVPLKAVLAGHDDVPLDPRSIDEPALIDWYREQAGNHRW